MPKRPAVERKKRQQTKREIIREKQAVARVAWQAAENIRLEGIAEDQAPAAQRQTVIGLRAGITDPIILREPTAVRHPTTGGYRRANPLMRMHRAAPNRFQRFHLAAAERFS